MGQVVVTVAGRTYRMACEDGEEPHLEALAAALDGKIGELKSAFGEIGEMRLHVMAALFFADDATDLKRRFATAESELAALRAEKEALTAAIAAERARLAEAIDETARRIEQVSRALIGGPG